MTSLSFSLVAATCTHAQLLILRGSVRSPELSCNSNNNQEQDLGISGGVFDIVYQRVSKMLNDLHCQVLNSKSRIIVFIILWKRF